jgi:SpoVK/Ycf46/Vps4 family AAA+-type ATPase
VIVELQALPPGAGEPLGPPVYLSYAGAVSEFGETVGVAAAVARGLGLSPGASVAVAALPGAPQATRVTVEPVSSDDWEVVELNAGTIEAHLLSQTGVAAVGQPLTLWVRGQPIALAVTATEPPTKVVRLVEGTEVAIAPRPRGGAAAKESNGAVAVVENGGAESGASKVVRTALRLLVSEGKQEGDENGAEALPRGVYSAQVAPRTLERCGLQAGDWAALRSPRGGATTVRLAESSSVALGHISIPEMARQAMGAEPFDPVALRRLPPLEKQALIEAAAAAAAAAAKSGTTASGSGEDASPWRSPWSMLSPAMAGTASPAARAAAAGASDPSLLRVPSSQRAAAEKLLAGVLPALAAGPRSVLRAWGAPRSGAILIAGPAGSGKTSLVRSLAAALASHPSTLASVHTVQCRELVNDQDVEKIVSAAVAAAAAAQPAILLLEDVDVLCPGAPPQAEPHPSEENADHGAAVTAWLSEILDGLSGSGEAWARGGGAVKGAGVGLWPAVAVVGTARDAAGLAPALREVGRFETVVHLAPPTADSRAEMLSGVAAARGLAADPMALRGAATTADGFDGADLAVLLDRAVNLAVARQLGSLSTGKTTLDAPLALTAADLEGAAAGMVPAAFWGSGTRTTVQAGVQGWEDVGGMETVREALTEAMELPVKHAALVAGAPLRLRTGALLYGPPGCGKTHVVAAAVAATGVRCITVSGPELLNKYIGASEAAVRDVFRRAAAAAPSVLFFDEFDAIAPQRGHDNTGVTDRVVNQLLTELDGVEGLRGVAVVAATSRPDLIDAALLRPGRLDRLLRCEFPDWNERMAILKALSRRLPMAADVDLQDVVAMSEGFSGADLGAVLAEAQLAAAHEALDAGETRHAAAAAVAERHLDEAVAAARPSVSAAERTRLDAIYDRFETGGERGFPDGSAAGANAGKKVSWA